MNSGQANSPSGIVASLSKAINAQPAELLAALSAFLYIFSLLCSYYVLRPVRDAMGIAGGVENLPWLFAGTFTAMLAVVPAYGWLCGRFARAVFLPWVYLFFISNILIFYFAFLTSPDDPWVARVFFIWVSVFNLFVVSVFWSFMADLFAEEQAKRLFGFFAAGGSAGALTGPALTALLAESWGLVNLLLLSASILFLTVILIRVLLHWERSSPASKLNIEGNIQSEDKPIGGNPFAGISLFFKSRYLLGIGAFIVLYTAMGTFMYLQQAELVRDAFATSAERTQLFAGVDFAVNTLAIFTQLFLTGRVVKKFGMTITLMALPVFMIFGFIALAIAPILPVLIVVQVIRRAGNYAITRPGREMLFTVLDKESKYKAKNVIDTVVYRGGDVVNAWFFKALGMLGLALAGTAMVGSVVAALWALTGLWLGRAFGRGEGAASAAPETGRIQPA